MKQKVEIDISIVWLRQPNLNKYIGIVNIRRLRTWLSSYFRIPEIHSSNPFEIVLDHFSVNLVECIKKMREKKVT